MEVSELWELASTILSSSWCSKVTFWSNRCNNSLSFWNWIWQMEAWEWLQLRLLLNFVVEEAVLGVDHFVVRCWGDKYRRLVKSCERLEGMQIP